ncbi:mRNA-degrading endonuclease RelE of RelBE toxin-antitoxin system [Arthrobacter sp. V4I6]|uniref:type II toxin-antitoxin system RelE family toxin n=1 Tax=unclassified Arthrobacter TaxID=235627 RepID=UPI00277E6A37|nr:MULTISPECIES: type II toxin-antitoxin system RelE/ParE family toxin [unclassified Arthrobacter]MDQ0820060.1 mRNA-degrading endonuclease RelE of RelBE toxin-antitoxin system [Arthrobacter sp. V1I7]MDQ0854242.1 mRNA-degrading endonuclease RelE of RelBE toxin-antitoxin system [Arthrobacter sp. V4I6]
MREVCKARRRLASRGLQHMLKRQITSGQNQLWTLCLPFVSQVGENCCETHEAGILRWPSVQKTEAAAIVEFVTGALAENPYRLSKHLTNELLGLHTARRGDYRVLFTLDIEDHILYVHRIEHRSDVYKPRQQPGDDTS